MNSIPKPLVSVEFNMRFRDRPAKIIGNTDGKGGPLLPVRIEFMDAEGGKTHFNSITIDELAEIVRAFRAWTSER